MYIQSDRIMEDSCAAARCLSAPSLCLFSPSISCCSFSDMVIFNRLALMRGQ